MWYLSSVGLEHSATNGEATGSSPVGTTKDPRIVGGIAEGALLFKFLQRGWTVLTPFGQWHRYDFVIDRGMGFERVQVKNAVLKNGVVIFRAVGSKGKRESYLKDADLFGSYCPANGKMLFSSS